MATSTSSTALPYVWWSTGTEAVVPAAQWEYVYASMQALKAHVQEYPGCQSFDVFAGIDDGGSVRLHCYTTWDTPEQAEAFVERGYTFERMLADVAGLAPEWSMMMEKVF